MIWTHNMGFPRMGGNRELKTALESYWKDGKLRTTLLESAYTIRQDNWEKQRLKRLNFLPVCDFSLYDTVLDHAMVFGLLPEHLLKQNIEDDLTKYFLMARGRSPNTDVVVDAGKMTKWFDTNYHYIAPEVGSYTKLTANYELLLDPIRRSRQQGHSIKPTIIGPLTLLWLARSSNKKFDVLTLYPELLALYQSLLNEIKSLGVKWVQLDEPILALELPTKWANAYKKYSSKLCVSSLNIMIGTYFSSIKDNLPVIANCGANAIHLDLSANQDMSAAQVHKKLPKDVEISLGVIDGRNIWVNNLKESITKIEPWTKLNRQLWLAPSCSLLHCPLDVSLETKLKNPTLSWLSFAMQKLDELEIIRTGVVEGQSKIKNELKANKAIFESKKQSKNVRNAEVRLRVKKIKPAWLKRNASYKKRIKLQQKKLALPLFPTTTIGSFPQTDAIRNNRLKFKQGKLTKEKYLNFIKREIKNSVKIQEEIGLDVLVHGEPERNDMVEYFGQQLKGFAFTEHGWVQSYGSRCVKPPIIYGDVSRSKSMTVQLSKYTKSVTSLPIKGMLTGPVTILCWSFARDDIPREDICTQLALALRDEVSDLEKAGIDIIQIDEPALREGLPLKENKKRAYLKWAVDSFKLATSNVDDSTQIHTHMCYSKFSDIMSTIIKLDADVISIETSRSKMELLEVFNKLNYPNSIGLGVYDIHSPNTPSSDQIVEFLQSASKHIPLQSLWVNPDCGLKTRTWDEVIPALKEMVAAAKEMRAQHEAS